MSVGRCAFVRFSLSLLSTKIISGIYNIDKDVEDAQRRREELNERAVTVEKELKSIADVLKRSEEAIFKVVWMCFGLAHYRHS